MKSEVYRTTFDWRMYQDQETIRIEKKVDNKWVVKFVIMPIRARYLKRYYKYQVRRYEKPGHHTEGPCYTNLNGVLQHLKRWSSLELPEEIIDVLESWNLMDVMGKKL